MRTTCAIDMRELFTFVGSSCKFRCDGSQESFGEIDLSEVNHNSRLGLFIMIMRVYVIRYQPKEVTRKDKKLHFIVSWLVSVRNS